MRRRTLLRAMCAGLTAGVAGCIGGGSEVVTSVNRELTVRTGRGWMTEIPDVSEHGGAIQYTARASQPFDVYFFTDQSQYMAYDTYIDGESPDSTPAGNESLGTTADKQGTEYVAETDDGGSRESIESEGPYYFVVDHSAYREETAPDEFAEDLSVLVDLTVTAKRFL